ncbi:MAG: hypothetical protein JW384_04189 [Nitrosomonadaceae bacterium]|nr:hypothetical protein [Nitrosomonadaceae bacterium]
MTKRFETEPDTPGDEIAADSLLAKQLQQKIGLLESKLRDIEGKLNDISKDPAFATRVNMDDVSWVNNEGSLGSISGTLERTPLINGTKNIGRLRMTDELKARLDDDIK